MTSDPDDGRDVSSRTPTSSSRSPSRTATRPQLLADSQAQVVAGLNRYYHVTIDPAARWCLLRDRRPRAGSCSGPDGAAYVIDTHRRHGLPGEPADRRQAAASCRRRARTVRRRRPSATRGCSPPGAGTSSSWTTSTRCGAGTRPRATRRAAASLIKVNIPDNVNWGLGARAIGTFVINRSSGQYNLYIVVPSAQQILKYPPASDGSSYPKAGRAQLPDRRPGRLDGRRHVRRRQGLPGRQGQDHPVRARPGQGWAGSAGRRRTDTIGDILLRPKARSTRA